MTGISNAEQARREASKRWRQRNKEKSANIDKKYRDTHLEECNERNKKYVKPYSDFSDEMKKRKEENQRNRLEVMFSAGGEKAKQYIADRLIRASRHRAKKRGIEHTLLKGDIVIPEMCPVLNVPIYIQQGLNEEVVGDKLNYSPQLDRIESSKGYTKDNVIVVSAKANRIKSNASPEEILLVANFYQKLMR